MILFVSFSYLRYITFALVGLKEPSTMKTLLRQNRLFFKKLATLSPVNQYQITRNVKD